MLGNLRGIRESGTIFMVPTYAYIVVMLAIIGYGVARRWRYRRRSRSSRRRPVGRPRSERPRRLGLFLILRAFSQGPSP